MLDREAARRKKGECHGERLAAPRLLLRCQGSRRPAREGANPEGCGISTPHERRNASSVGDELDRRFESFVGASRIDGDRDPFGSESANTVGESIAVVTVPMSSVTPLRADQVPAVRTLAAAD